MMVIYGVLLGGIPYLELDGEQELHQTVEEEVVVVARPQMMGVAGEGEVVQASSWLVGRYLFLCKFRGSYGGEVFLRVSV